MLAHQTTDEPWSDVESLCFQVRCWRDDNSSAWHQARSRCSPQLFDRAERFVSVPDFVEAIRTCFWPEDARPFDALDEDCRVVFAIKATAAHAVLGRVINVSDTHVAHEQGYCGSYDLLDALQVAYRLDRLNPEASYSGLLRVIANEVQRRAARASNRQICNALDLCVSKFIELVEDELRFEGEVSTARRQGLRNRPR